ncbi:MAG: glycosyltransferase family 2 protein [Candidatus Diapherotrites archaeon]
MELSIIIPNYNTKGYLEKCLNSIKKNAPSCSHEVIVVDDASRDNSVEMIKKKFREVKLITNEKNLGFSKSLNKGIKESKGSFVLFLNSDALLLPHSINGMISALKCNSKAGIAGCRLLNKDNSVQFTFGYFPFFSTFIKRNIFGFRLKEKNEPFAVDWVCAACFLIKRKTIKEIGLFDEGFETYNEEVDYCYRAKKKGLLTLYVPSASIIHFQGGAINKKGFEYIKENTIKSNYVFLKKHKGIHEAVIAAIYLKLKYLLGK